MAEYLIKAETLTSIADAIRSKTGKTDRLTPNEMASGVNDVHEAGKKTEYDAFWDACQGNGERTHYTYGFAGNGWTDENFKPKYDIKPQNNANGLFRNTRIVNLKQCIESCGVELDLSGVTSFVDGFRQNYNLKVLPKLDCSKLAGLTDVFTDATALETIEELKVSETTAYNSTFYNCNSLTHMIMTGVIAKNIDLHWSTKLTHESLMSIINVLQTKTSGTWTVTLGTTNLNKLTDAEKAIATQKGWTLA